MKTRRVVAVAFLSLAFAIVLLFMHPTAYGIPGLSYVKDTPFSYLIGFILGSISATLVYPVSPGMEALAVGRVGRSRMLVALLACVVQCAMIVFVATGLREAAGLDVPWSAVTVFASSTIFFHGIGMLSAGFFHGMRVWIVPIALVVFLLMFAWKDRDTPQPWNILLHTNPLLFSMALAVFVSGLMVVRVRNPKEEAAT